MRRKGSPIGVPKRKPPWAWWHVRKFINLSILFSLVFLTSCILIEKYPANWGALILKDNDKCVDVSGTYSDSGTSDWGYCPSLTYLIYGDEDLPFAAEKSIQLRLLNEKTLETSTWKGNELLLRKELKCECTSGGLKIPCDASVVGLGEGLTVGVEFGVLYLGKNADGSLVVRKKTYGVGACLIIPVAGIGSSWYRFKPVETETRAE